MKHYYAQILAGGARIVGGTNATKPYPYQVSLQTLLVYQTPNGKIKQFSHVCGGSIITKRHILTAGKFLAISFART